MRFSPLSFVLGLAAASLVPLISRVFRPLAVEAAAAGMGVFEDTRRLVAEQMETLEDIDADALAASLEPAEEAGEEPVAAAPSRRRANGSARRRS